MSYEDQEAPNPNIVRERVVVDLRRSAQPDGQCYLLICLSCIIATAGLVANSVAVIIGGMLVAPLVPPIMASLLPPWASAEPCWNVRPFQLERERRWLSPCLLFLPGSLSRGRLMLSASFFSRSLAEKPPFGHLLAARFSGREIVMRFIRAY